MVPSDFRNLSSNFDIESLAGIQSLDVDGVGLVSELNDQITHGSDCCTTLRKKTQSWQYVMYAGNGISQLLDVATKFLS
jgi:hypothetical protein